MVIKWPLNGVRAPGWVCGYSSIDRLPAIRPRDDDIERIIPTKELTVSSLSRNVLQKLLGAVEKRKSRARSG